MTGVTAVSRSWVLIGVLAFLSAAPSLANGFVFDDVPIVLENPRVHTLESSAQIWRTPYWANGLLYRPLTVQLFALQWAVGSGSAVVFHLTSVLLSLAVALAFWCLARRLLPPTGATLAAALFAVHPVHVEVVGNVVGQAELLATLASLLVVERYLAWRPEGGLSAARRSALALLTFAAMLSKETGIMIPALLGAAELILFSRIEPSRRSFRALAPTFALQAVAVLAAILLRISVLGPTPAAGPSVALRTLEASDRIIGMLAVVPHWLRLLAWPAHLQAEYGPPALMITGTIGIAHVLGMALLAAAAAVVVATWRRAPVIAFGVVWIAGALLPVSNVLTTTGVVLAERTLFLPSAGAMLALGGVLAAIWPRLPSGTRVWRATVASAMIVIVAGTVRSMERQLVWRSQPEFFERIQTDAPTTYRAFLVASEWYAHTGNAAEAERTARRGLELYQGDPKLYEHLGQILRRQQRCGEAVPILEEGTFRFPDRTTLRSRYIECTLATGDTMMARRIAQEAVALGLTEFEQTIRRLGERP